MFIISKFRKKNYKKSNSSQFTSRCFFLLERFKGRGEGVGRGQGVAGCHGGGRGSTAEPRHLRRAASGSRGRGRVLIGRRAPRPQVHRAPRDPFSGQSDGHGCGGDEKPRRKNDNSNNNNNGSELGLRRMWLEKPSDEFDLRWSTIREPPRLRLRCTKTIGSSRVVDISRGDDIRAFLVEAAS